MTEGITYADAGVDYGPMDDFKRFAQKQAKKTASNAGDRVPHEIAESRGESAFLYTSIPGISAFVPEGLGTKMLVADGMYRQTGTPFYWHIGWDTVAATANDIAASGALPTTIGMFLAVGSSEWFNDDRRWMDLVIGFRDACNYCGFVWGPGETQVDEGLIMPQTCLLAAPGSGYTPEGRVISGQIRAGDAIVLIGSTGIHANGASLARKVADKLPGGYRTKISSTRTYGEELLEPAYIYTHIVNECLTRGVNIHYAVPITGHGWRKLMRHPSPYAYVIERLPDSLPIFEFIQEHGPVADKEAYATFNMGAGFALYVPPDDVKTIHGILDRYSGRNRVSAVLAGYVEESREKKVVIKPKGITFTADSLNIR